MFEIFVAEAVVFGAEDKRNFPLFSGSGDTRSDFSWRLAMGAIEAGAAGGANDQRAVGDGGANGIVAFGFAEHVAAVHCHRLGPKALGARCADDGQVRAAEIFHCARHRAYIARAARANHHYSNIA